VCYYFFHEFYTHTTSRRTLHWHQHQHRRPTLYNKFNFSILHTTQLLPYHTLLMSSNIMSLNSPWWLPMPSPNRFYLAWLGGGERPHIYRTPWLYVHLLHFSTIRVFSIFNLSYKYSSLEHSTLHHEASYLATILSLCIAKLVSCDFHNLLECSKYALHVSTCSNGSQLQLLHGSNCTPTRWSFYRSQSGHNPCFWIYLKFNPCQLACFP